MAETSTKKLRCHKLPAHHPFRYGNELYWKKGIIVSLALHEFDGIDLKKLFVAIDNIAVMIGS